MHAVPRFDALLPPPARIAALWGEQTLLAAEASAVIGMRLWMLALSDPRAARESSRMVSEKVEALGEAWWALATMQATALLGGRQTSADRQAARVVRLYRRKVRANLRRLAS